MLTMHLQNISEHYPTPTPPIHPSAISYQIKPYQTIPNHTIPYHTKPYLLAEAVSAGDVVEIVGPGQVGDVAAPGLHVARHLVSAVLQEDVNITVLAVELEANICEVGSFTFHNQGEVPNSQM